MRAWAQTRIPIEVSRPNPGWAEHDPKDWWAGFNAVIRHLTGGDERILSRVSAVGVSGICPVVLPVDHEGRGLRPTILYSIDQDRKSTRLNSSHVAISYAVFCLKKK